MSFARADYVDWTRIAEGGEAEIFRARQASLDRLVAIKRLKLLSLGKDEDVKRFEREAKLFASLSHPALVQIHDYGRDDRYYYQVMEYVAGIDLGRLAGRSGHTGLPLPVKVLMARQMTEVVDFIHQQSVLHRDLKPENFMVDAAGRIKLLDLGMARAGGIPSRTDAGGGLLKGTMAYLPPELLRGRGPWRNVSEYYCLALVLLELFGDRRFHQDRTVDEILAVIQGGIPLEGFPDVPLGVRDLLAPYLDPDPERRPSDLEPLVKGFRRMQGDSMTLDGGSEALEAAVRREQRAWLWSLADSLEEENRHEEAFARLKEILELDPADAEAQERLQDLVMLMNEAPPEGNLAVAGDGRRRRNRALAGVVSILLLAAGMLAAWIFYIRRVPEAEEMGRGLMERELIILSSENQAAPAVLGRVEARLSARPPVRPYGVLIVTGIPKGYQVLVNRVRYPAHGEIHLPASRHLVEIQDAGRRSVLRDSVTVGGGEPTVFEYARRAAPPLSQRSGEP
ncbi:MAG TPA: serine/threonine-protein kinase [Fibrobacteria bacterium]|nr:serine/threonine-protein kinase [Fibrobacteria bacterium]